MRFILKFLKDKKLFDIETVNKLIVSSYIIKNNLNVLNNLLLKDLLITDNEDGKHLLKEFLQVIHDENELDIENLINIFEFVISPSDRIITGAVYTPPYIRDVIIKKCLEVYGNKDLEFLRIADISCGCGGFLIDVARYLHIKTGKTYKQIFKHNIFGVDIESYSVARTKILLSLLALSDGEDTELEFNIKEADSLDFKSCNWDPVYSQFDIIVGNPPYVCSKKIDERTKMKMPLYEVCSTGHPDLYIPFFQIAIEMLSKNGKLGYITMNSFIRSLNGRGIREYLNKCKYKISIIDFRGLQIFPKRNTYTCLFFLDKGKASNIINYAIEENKLLEKEIIYSQIRYEVLDDKKGWALNNFDWVNKINNIGISLYKYCTYRHGIATLSNKIYIFSPTREDKEYYFFKDRGSEIKIEKGICRDIVNSNKFNSNKTLSDISEKIIFPYTIKDGEKAKVIEESFFRSSYPFAYAYLDSYKHLLNLRDKGKIQSYPAWYAFGRTQSLSLPRYKLFYPKIANNSIHCTIVDDKELMLYNGMAFVSEDLKKLEILKCILESDIFWGYITLNAKPYSSGYYSLSGVDIKNFGIPVFSKKEIDQLLSLTTKDERDLWLRQFYS